MTDQPRHEPTRALYGHITHADLASTDPDATKAWCERVLGWTFTFSVRNPDGSEYHLVAFSGVTTAIVRAPGGFPIGFSGP